jgi:hypothetical protein
MAWKSQTRSSSGGQWHEDGCGAGSSEPCTCEKPFPMDAIPVGERRITKAKKRVIVAVEQVDVGRRGGKVEFYFEDEGPREFHQRMSYRKWLGYELV